MAAGTVAVTAALAVLADLDAFKGLLGFDFLAFAALAVCLGLVVPATDADTEELPTVADDDGCVLTAFLTNRLRPHDWLS